MGVLAARRVHEGLHPGDERVGLAGGHPGERAGQQVQAEHLAVPAQRVMAGRGQPDQRAPPVRRVVLALEQPLIPQPAQGPADRWWPGTPR